MKPLKQIIPKRMAKRISAGRLAVGVSRIDDGFEWKFDDGGTALGSCIRCDMPRCMFFSDDELIVSGEMEFPSDLNASVCPTGAITWPDDSTCPDIDPESCIACGLCVTRCPAKAIGLDKLEAIVNDKENGYFELTNEAASPDTEAAARTQLDVVKGLPSLVDGSQVNWAEYEAKFIAISASQTAQFPNHLVRNILIELGVQCAMRRRGDTNIRMDLFASYGEGSF